MADLNISAETLIPQDSELSNMDAIDRSVDDIVLSMTSNFVTVASGAQNVTALQGDVTFQFSTGMDEWIQMPKTFLGVDYQVKADVSTAAATSYSVALAPCLFNSARFEIEGQRVATSNNYTFDWALSNRLQYSADYNKNINGLMYTTHAAAATEATELDVPDFVPQEGVRAAAADFSKYTSIDNLGALFFVKENLLLPPNTHYRLTLTPETYEVYKQKSLLGAETSAVTSIEISLNRIYLSLHRIRLINRPAQDFSIRLVTIESNASTPTTTTHNIQYQVSSKMRKCGVALVSTASRNAMAHKKHNETRFRYVEDIHDVPTSGDATFVYGQGLGSINAHGLARLQLRAGSLLMPNNIWDFTRNGSAGLKAAYMHFLNSTGKYNDNGKPETFREWLNQGPIYIEDAVKGNKDLSTNLQIEAQFALAPAATFYSFQVNETVIGFTWGGPDNAVPSFKYPTSVTV